MDFRDTEQAVTERVRDLLARLTLAEKTALLHQHQPAVPRLGLGPFRTGTEALHGLAWLGPATVFPQAVGLASTWNPALVRAVGAAVGDEARGLFHKDPTRGGLNVWAPVVNPLRDPRWGRNEEGYAEDPWLTAVMATAYAGGLRGEHPRFLKTAPTLKHFLGYNNETRRELTSTNLPPRVLREYELPAFRGPIAAGAAVAVMASYNLVNGRPAHLSPLINDELRAWTTDEVLFVSDAAAPTNVATAQGYYPDHVTSHAALLRAGIDSFTDNDDRPELTIERVTAALDAGLIDESDIDTAVRRILTIRFRLGEFDPPAANPYASITADVINCPAHQRLARLAAQQSFVLLRNQSDLLPLPAAPGRLAVIGVLADNLYEDWYSGTLPYSMTARTGLAERFGADRIEFIEGVDRVVFRVAGGQVVASAEPEGAALRVGPGSAADGPVGAFDIIDWGNGIFALRAVANGRHVTVDEHGLLINDQLRPNGWVVRETFRFAPTTAGQMHIRHIASGRFVTVDGSGRLSATVDGPDDAREFTLELLASGRAEAVRAARACDVAVVVVGNHPLINGRETEDRVDLNLPATQDELIRAVHAANPRTVLVVQSSYPFAIGWAEEHLPAILWSAHGGQEFGHALADVLTGDVAPAGRLTQTWYRDAADLPDLFDYDIVASDATYLYFRGTPLYPFGHGLTYTAFEYSGLHCGPSPADTDGIVDVTLQVRNTGPRAGDEVVQLYTRQQRSRVKQPLRQLRGFQRVRLEPGQAKTVHFGLSVADLAYWDVTQNRFVVEEGQYTVMVGRSAADIRVAATIVVRGERIPRRPGHDAVLAATAFDDYAGVRLRDATPVAGDAVTATEAGAWILFEGTDFGPGARSARVRVSGTGQDAGVTLRLDDPLAGLAIGSARAFGPSGRYAWEEPTIDLADAVGVHDLYVVFSAPGVGLESIVFS